MVLLASGISEYLLPLGLLLIIGSLLLRSRRFLRRRRGAEPALVKASQSLDPAVRDRLAGNSELSDLQVQIHELSRSAKAELDTKMVVLEQLIVEAQAERGKLESLLDRVHNRALPTKVCESTDPAIPGQEPERVDPLEAEIYALADAGLAEEEISLRVGNSPDQIAQILNQRDA